MSTDATLARIAERFALSAREAAERRFTEQGRAASAGAANPYKPGSAAATWWQRGRNASQK